MGKRPPDPTDGVLASITPLATTVPGEDGYEPLGQAIAGRVREAIIDGRLGAGTRIRQEALARHLGTSRIPVREALGQLENEGLIVLVPHSGARVARLELAELQELYRIREAVEPLAIGASAPELDDARLATLAELVAAIEAAGREGDMQRWLACDRRFHLESYAAAPMPRVLAMIEGFWNTTQQYRRAYFGTLGERELELVNGEHRLILDALERRDGVDAETRQRSHIRRTRLRLVAQSGSETWDGDHDLSALYADANRQAG